MEQIVTIDLFGRPYRFKTTSDGSRARKIAELLIREVSRVQAGETGKKRELADVAIMIIVALNLANENYDLQKKCNDIMENVSEGTSRVLRQLDSGLLSFPKGENTAHLDKG